MTEIVTIDWYRRWGTSVFSENTAIFFYSMNPPLFLENITIIHYNNILSDYRTGMEYSYWHLYSYLLEYCFFFFFSTQLYSVLGENYEYKYLYVLEY